MITVDQLPEASIDAARLAMAIALAADGDGIPEAIVAAINAWEGMNAKAATDHVMLLNSTPALILPLPTENPDVEA